MNTKRILFVAVMVCGLLSACERDETDFVPPASATRTVLVYLGVDNNFRAEAAQKIETLRENLRCDADGNLLVYADAGEMPVLVHIYYHPQKGGAADTIARYQPENSARPQTLARVLNNVKTYRPAASYGLVVLSHATGWLPAEMSKPTPVLRSIIWDTGTAAADNYMEIADFAAAIPYKLDFIIFDACFMGAVEVCYELKDKAEYIVASPAEVLSPGFDYSTMMQRLLAPEEAAANSPTVAPTNSPTGGGKSDLFERLAGVASDFYDYFDRQSGLFRSATVSVVKTSELEALKTAFQSALHQSPPAGDLGGLQTFGYGQQKIYFDLGDFVQQLSPDDFPAFQAALDRCILYKNHTSAYYSAGTATLTPIRTFSGLSIYIPQEIYPEANEEWGKLRWGE